MFPYIQKKCNKLWKKNLFLQYYSSHAVEMQKLQEKVSISNTYRKKIKTL